MIDKTKLITTIEKYVIKPYKDLVLKEIKPSIRLKTTGKSSEELGKTKLGGCPDLPKKTNWPKSNYDNTFLSFLGQVNMKDVKLFDELNFLPNEGILYFFFNLDSGDDGKVLFSKEVNIIERVASPEEFKEEKKSFLKRLFTGKSKKRILLESGVEIYKEYNFPSWDSFPLELIQKKLETDIKPISAFKEGIFDHCYDEGENESTSNHHLCGNYNGIQNEFHELDFIHDELDDFNNLSIIQIKKALKWKLLFQFDSDENLEFNFGDCGRIYFFIHEDDLKNENFNNIRISADSY